MSTAFCHRPACHNCLNWMINKIAALNPKPLKMKFKGPKDICCGGFHKTTGKNPAKDGIWTGVCEDFRTGPQF